MLVSQCLSKDVTIGNTQIVTENQRDRCRTWCFTLNNYTDEEVSQMSKNIWTLNKYPFTLKIKKLIFQKEISKTGTPHLQGCIEFVNQASFSSLKIFNKRIRWDKTKEWKASVYYCSKTISRDGKERNKNNFFIYGISDNELWKEPKKKEIGKNIRDEDKIREDMRNQIMDDIDNGKWPAFQHF